MSDDSAKTGTGNTGATKSGSDNTPPLDFTTLVLSMTESALLMLGVKSPPGGGAAKVSLAEAKYYIDMLALLCEKTKGNLTPDEERLLNGALYELRMHYVQRQSA